MLSPGSIRVWKVRSWKKDGVEILLRFKSKDKNGGNCEFWS